MPGAGLVGFLQNLSGGEMIVIAIVALVVLGPERLPDMARNVGRGIHKLKSMTEGLQGEVREVMDDPAMQSFRELGELAARPRQKLSEYAAEAEAEEQSRRNAAAHAAHSAAVIAAEAYEEAEEAEAAAVDDSVETAADREDRAGDDRGDPPEGTSEPERPAPAPTSHERDTA